MKYFEYDYNYDEFDENDEYEKKCIDIIKENEEYLTLFEDDLIGSGFSEKTIVKHIDNVSFYINTFLTYYEPKHMEEGCFTLGSYLGGFFIRKCMWSTPSSIKTTAASIKKFYKCMLKNNKIEADSYEHLCFSIKYDMEDWQSYCAKFNDPNRYDSFLN